jgi:hypothetical protein
MGRSDPRHPDPLQAERARGGYPASGAAFGDRRQSPISRPGRVVRSDKRASIETFLEDAPPPVIAKVYRATPAQLAEDPTAAGRVERWYPK